MYTVYALESLPDPCRASIFLAGPTPRDPTTPSWRPEALRLLAELGYTGAVIIPEAQGGEWRHSYLEQADWEVAMRARADLIVFWVPRKLTAVPAFTTNVEFGEDYDSCRCLYGRPVEAPKCRYLDARWHAMTGRTPHNDLRDVLAEAVTLLGVGADRRGIERDVPLAVWRSEPFVTWYQQLMATGRDLRLFEVCYVLPLGPRHPASPLFGILARAAVSGNGDNDLDTKELFLVSTPPASDGTIPV